MIRYNHVSINMWFITTCFHSLVSLYLKHKEHILINVVGEAINTFGTRMVGITLEEIRQFLPQYIAFPFPLLHTYTLAFCLGFHGQLASFCSGHDEEECHHIPVHARYLLPPLTSQYIY